MADINEKFEKLHAMILAEKTFPDDDRDALTEKLLEECDDAHVREAFKCMGFNVYSDSYYHWRAERDKHVTKE